MPRSHRQEALRSRYHFDCDCLRCRDDLDVYQVCQQNPYLHVNEATLSPDLETLRNPLIGASLSADKSLRRHVEEIYSRNSGSLQGADPSQKREELKRRWKECSRLRSARLFAVEPLCQVLVEASIYFGERGDFAAALVVMSFVAFYVDPYRSPMPFGAQRLKGLLMLAKLLTHTAAAFAGAGGGATPAPSLSGAVGSKVSEILARADQVTACHLLLVFIMRFSPTAHSGEPLSGEAAELLHEIESLEGRQQETSMLQAISRNPGGEDESQFMEIVLGPVRELAELALDVLTEEFGP